MSVEIVRPARLRGVLHTPGDKSISHRAVMLAALADGPSRITGLSSGEDVRHTIGIVAALGAGVREDGGRLTVNGPAGGLSPAPHALDCGNSGTTIRLLCGLLGSVPGEHHLDGDGSLRRRPMDRVAQPLGRMGLRVEGQGERQLPPLRVVREDGELRGIDYDVPVPSAQVKSAVLLAALAASGETTVREKIRTRANTEEMLSRAGVVVESVDQDAGRVIRLRPSRPVPVDWAVPGDPSQAAFFLVAAVLHPDAEVRIEGLYPGRERTGFLSVLLRMGADLEIEHTGDTIAVTARSSSLRATTVRAEEIPSVDEVPILAVAAAGAVGETRFVDVGELRVKESDRLTGTVALLSRLGVPARGEGEDLVVDGLGFAERFEEFHYEGSLDHRMVMAAAVAATVGSGASLSGTATVATSYPSFFEDLASLR